MSGKGKTWLCLLGLIGVFARPTPALGQFLLFNDCNTNGIKDECDIDCNAADCNTNDCGGSTDCDSNGNPDECDAHTVYYVDVDAIGNSNGLSWTDAYDDLKSALDNINANMPCGIAEVWVAEGTYYPTSTNDPPEVRRLQSIQLRDNFYVYGGFAGGETSRGQRDHVAHPTVLSGDWDQNDDNPQTPSTANNSYSVVLYDTINGLYSLERYTAILDGFTIRDGNADDASNPDGPTTFGGGAYIFGGVPLIRNCTFTDNFARKGGGGAFVTKVRNRSNIHKKDIFLNCTFDLNTATHGPGGGLLAQDLPYRYNEAANPPAVVLAAGVPAQIKRCVFTNNQATFTFTGAGRGDSGAGGGLAISVDGFIRPLSSVFMNNTAEYGGGMSVWSGASETINCTFMGNHANKTGGAVEASHDAARISQVVLHSCLLWGNTAGAGSSDQQVAFFEGTGMEPEVYYTDLMLGVAAIDNPAGATIITSNGGNIEDDPLFVPGDWHLSPFSPCVDVGEDTWGGWGNFDIDGDSRRFNTAAYLAGSKVDIGADEYIGPDCNLNLADDNWEANAKVLDPYVPLANYNREGSFANDPAPTAVDAYGRFVRIVTNASQEDNYNDALNNPLSFEFAKSFTLEATLSVELATGGTLNGKRFSGFGILINDSDGTGDYGGKGLVVHIERSADGLTNALFIRNADTGIVVVDDPLILNDLTAIHDLKLVVINNSAQLYWDGNAVGASLAVNGSFNAYRRPSVQFGNRSDTASSDVKVYALTYGPGKDVDNDCNTNGIPDDCDITSGFSLDCNSNGVPDECECVATDVNCDGATNAGDLLIVRGGGTWETCVDCPTCDVCTNGADKPRADVNDDCDVNAGDFLAIRNGAVWETSTGSCVCVPLCDGPTGCSAAMSDGGTGLVSSSLAVSGSSTTLSLASATLEVQPAGGGVALTTLQPNTAYELHYVADAPVNLYALFTVASSVAENATGIVAPASGTWSGTGSFVSEDWSLVKPLAAAPNFAGMYQLTATADALDSSTSAVNTGHLLDFTTGSAGTLAFEAYLSSIDATTGDWIDMPTATVFPVKLASP